MNGIDHKNCNNCNIPLCNEFGDDHKKEKPNHKVKVVPGKRLKKDDQMEKPKVNCVKCNKDIPVKNNASTLCSLLMY